MPKRLLSSNLAGLLYLRLYALAGRKRWAFIFLTFNIFVGPYQVAFRAI